MYSYTIGGKKGKKYILKESDQLFAVRTRNSREINNAIVSESGKQVLRDFEVFMEFPEADITVFQARESVRDVVAARNRAKSVLRNESELRFVGKVLVEADGKTLVLYTENLFIKFHDHLKSEVCEKILADHDLKIKQKPDYAKNAYFAGAPENTGLKIFGLSEDLLRMKEVEFCHPELIRKRSLRKIHPMQWHLHNTVIGGTAVEAGVNADLAHKITRGEGVVIALIDDGFDIDHQEFRQPGKVVNSRDVTARSNDPRPKNPYNNHGTACAGVATASGVNASGVAPGAILLPVRLSSNLGSMAEADAFKWAADHGADIISCSWGPEDGNWSDPDDPAHTSSTPLPDSTRLAIDYAVTNGRGGKGCIITFAAGNGNEDVEFDGYAGYGKVMAVAASGDTDRRCVYSDYGKKIWCCFPSSDFGYAPFNHPRPLTKGIYTTDRTGSEGYNPEGDYTDDFGGTSSSCPGVAGIIALILSVNPGLDWKQVRKLIRETAQKIDKTNGKYDVKGHSIFYGYGKTDAEKAVKRAIELRNGQDTKKRKKRETLNIF